MLMSQESPCFNPLHSGLSHNSALLSCLLQAFFRHLVKSDSTACKDQKQRYQVYEVRKQFYVTDSTYNTIIIIQSLCCHLQMTGGREQVVFIANTVVDAIIYMLKITCVGNANCKFTILFTRHSLHCKSPTCLLTRWLSFTVHTSAPNIST